MSAKIEKSRVVDLQVHAKIDNGAKLELAFDNRLKLCPPSDPNDNTAMIVVQSDISSSTHDIKMSCTAEFIFSFKPMPSNLMEYAKQNCSKVILDKLTDFIETTLLNMGCQIQESQQSNAL